MSSSTFCAERANSLTHRIRTSASPLVMGILNVTPDSFSDGGRFLGLDHALQHAEQLLTEGADILDIGGESTRPGAAAVSVEEERQRVIPVVEALSRELSCFISVDTSKPEIMRDAVNAGAVMINDVNALQAKGALEAVSGSACLICLMHMQGSPRTMQTDPQYENVVEDIISFLKSRAEQCVSAGIDATRLVIDPGFGFGKTLEHNYRLLGDLAALKQLALPILVGVSRKSMIGNLLDLPVDERLLPSVVCAALAAERGANIVRVHDVRETQQAMRLVEAVQSVRMIEGINGEYDE